MNRKVFNVFGKLMGVAALVFGVSFTSEADGPAFTKAQVNAGRTAYRNACAKCHGAKLEGAHPSPPLAGERFDQNWRGKSVDVLAFHVRRMPPAALADSVEVSDEDYINILAYILMSNGFEMGETALPSDLAALSGIKIPRLEGVSYDPLAPVEPSDEQAALLEHLSPVTGDVLLNPPPGDWLQWGRTYNGHNFSPLDQINKDNVGDLKPAWHAPLRPGTSMASPVVHDGVMFLHAFPDTVIAMDATTGAILWRHEYDSKTGSSSKLGVSFHGDNVLVPTSDLHVLALNAKTGDEVWDHKIETEATGGYQLRSEPLVVGDKVIQGITASFASKGGFILGIDANTGEECWRFNTIARPGEFGGETWNDVPMERRSGGSVWHQGTYDPELNLIYYGVAPTYDTGPLLHPVDKDGVTNDALYTNCTVAINPDTGDLVWHYQHVANDQWDLDWAFERQIATVPIDGKPRKIVMNMGKMVLLDALDAATGEYLFSVDSGVQNVITAIDPKTGAKTINPDMMPDLERPCTVCPTAAGARAWPTTSFSPKTNYVYVPITEACMLLSENGFKLLTSGVGISDAPHPDADDGMMGRVQAIDVANQQRAWNHDVVAPTSTSTLATAGGVVFCGDMGPTLRAFDDKTGDVLWEAKLDDVPSANLVTYSVNDTQYVAVVVGISNLHVDFLSRSYATFAAGLNPPPAPAPKGGAAVWVFAL